MRPLLFTIFSSMLFALIEIPAAYGQSVATMVESNSPLPGADLEAGRILAYTCQGCHGISGYKNAYPNYRVPKIGGQSAAYLVEALTGYRQGTRQHPTMQAQSLSLSPQQIENVAAYLSTLK